MREPSSGDAVEWRVHLAAREPGRAVLAAGACAAAGAWAFVLFGSPGMALASAGLLLAAVGEFLFPVRYRLNAGGAEARGLLYWRRIGWGDVARVHETADAVKLSPLRCGGPREAFRGVLLRCSANRQEVLDAIRRYRDAADPR